MSFFGRSSNEPSQPASPAPPQRPTPAAPNRTESTHIANGSKVVGEISGSTQLHVDGVVEGQINLGSHVEVGDKGKVIGEIHARSVKIGGQVTGNVQGVERVEVLTAGRLEGDVTSPRVVIAEGAFFKGKVEMTDVKAPKPSASGGKKDPPTDNPSAAKAPPNPPSGPPQNKPSGSPQPNPSGQHTGKRRGK